MSDAYQEFGYGPAGHYETIYSKSRPVRELDLSDGSASPRCMRWGCNKVKLEWLEKGRSLQTRNGFFTSHFDQWMCPTCGGGYGSNPPHGSADAPDFRSELCALINKHSMENASNTPDFILAQYLTNCLRAWNQATQQRETWYGRDARPTSPPNDPDQTPQR